MKYPKPTDRYDCSVLCQNFEEIEARLLELEDENSGSGLPEVTEDDNNKILQVIDGVWQLVPVIDGNTAQFYADGNEVAY